MKRLPPADPVTVRSSPSRARATRALLLRAAGMTDKAIAAQMMSELPHGTKLIITADDVWRWCREADDRAEWAGAR